MKYVIEHMEEGFTEWVILEYSQILRDLGPENLILTSLPSTTKESDIPKQLLSLGLQWTTKELTEIINTPASRLCLLDPRATQDLQPEDAEQFDYFIFGGILGDHPPRDRTSELKLKLGNCATRRLGALQMTTDTAIRVTKLIIEKKQKFEDIPFIDYPEIRYNKREATEMPFRYVLDEQKKPILPQGMLELIKKDADKSLDDFF
ncbi:unnamed protein product [Ambrosiozyma monospora]|uniref:Unnamed protein product n=1 Tax=Ambrosiozyma monospora TaxID=43982 RepID=A0ACB5SUQ7_AMBMO|nr:unnamed protein product [Ambrosiozyma monospora]